MSDDTDLILLYDQRLEDVPAGTLASSVYDRLREDILSGTLAPDEKLRTEALRGRYGVGSSPIREALNRLTADGLVSREDQKGFRVVGASWAELEELIKTRCWLEEIALRESIANGGDSWEEEVVISFHRLVRTRRSFEGDVFGSNPEWEHRHRAFHLALISACGSRWLFQYCVQLIDQGERYCQLAKRFAMPGHTEIDEHELIMKAILERNVDETLRLMRQHFEPTVRIIRDHFPRSER